jgi:hypothetical protein
MQNILITGGTGLVGQALTQLLLKEGYQVSYLSRSEQNIPNIKTYLWDVKKQTIDAQAIQKADAIIHLAGAGVAEERWTNSRKQEILESRTDSTTLLVKALKDTSHAVKTFISASAIGYYGLDTGSTLINEDSQAGNDFLAEVTKSWERSVEDISDLGIRTTKLRIGVVLSEKGGALPKIMQPVKFGAGAALGSGKQYMSWIHIKDLARMFLFVLQQDKMEGIYNAVGPNPLNNAEITQAIAKTLGRPLFLPNVPEFALKLIMGEMAGIVTGGNRVSSQKIEKAGFDFQFAEISPALKDLIG